MSNDVVIIDYDPFAMESRVSICKEGKREHVTVYSTIDELTNGIIGLAYQHNIYDIKIHGPFAIACEIRKEVNRSEQNQYSQNKIKVEGI